MDRNHLNNFERGSTKDHSCEIWSKSYQWFRRRCCLKIVNGRRDGRTDRRTTKTTTDGEWSQYLTLSLWLRWANKNLKGCLYKQRTHKRMKIRDSVLLSLLASLCRSVGCASRLWSGRPRFEPCWVWQHFRRDGSWIIFYGHSLPSADSRRAVVSFWGKNVHKYCLTT